MVSTILSFKTSLFFQTMQNIYGESSLRPNGHLFSILMRLQFSNNDMTCRVTWILHIRLLTVFRSFQLGTSKSKVGFFWVWNRQKLNKLCKFSQKTSHPKENWGFEKKDSFPLRFFRWWRLKMTFNDRLSSQITVIEASSSQPNWRSWIL